MTGCDVFGKPVGMLKQVHDEKCKVKSHEYRVSGYESRFWPEACQNDGKDCHPELVLGSKLRKKPRLEVSSQRFEEQKNGFSVLRKERLQVPRCKKKKKSFFLRAMK
ncbi:hypothetical protein V513_10995 [Mesotoga sp. H07.pep.5.3]|nr:hypothetical protein V513_10995 [Mesotoga sp. H07.pep.5.3]